MFAFNDRAPTGRRTPRGIGYAVHGLNEDASNALRRIIVMLAGRTQREWIARNLDEAEVLILTPEAEVPAHGRVRCVVRVAPTDSNPLGDVSRLEFPFRVFQVLSTLAEVETRLDSVVERTARVATHNLSWSLFDALGELSRSTSQKRWFECSGEDGQRLLVRDDLQAYAAAPVMHAQLRAGRLPQTPLQPSPLSEPDLPVFPGAELLWLVGLHSGRGNLSGSLDAQCLFQLQAWPDFGLLRPLPIHLRLCALLASGAFSRDQLLEQLDPRVSVVEVNRLLNACATLGLLHAERRNAAATHTRKSSERSFIGGLVASIRRKLGIGR